MVVPLLILQGFQVVPQVIYILKLGNNHSLMEKAHRISNKHGGLNRGASLLSFAQLRKETELFLLLLRMSLARKDRRNSSKAKRHIKGVKVRFRIKKTLLLFLNRSLKATIGKETL